MLRIPHFVDNRLTDGGEVVSLARWSAHSSPSLAAICLYNMTNKLPRIAKKACKMCTPSWSVFHSCCVRLLSEHSAYQAYVVTRAHRNWPYHINDKSIFRYVEWIPSAKFAVRFSPLTYADCYMRWGPHFILDGGFFETVNSSHITQLTFYFTFPLVFSRPPRLFWYSGTLNLFSPYFQLSNSCWTQALHVYELTGAQIFKFRLLLYSC
jgi:hypothetical protein